MDSGSRSPGSSPGSLGRNDGTEQPLFLRRVCRAELGDGHCPVRKARGDLQCAAERLDVAAQVADIAVQHACQRLHFLHAAIDAGGVPDNTQIGSYVIHYSNGEQAQFPIVIGQSLADWFTQPDEEKKTFTIGWSGYNAESRRQGRTIRLFKSTWQNPAPAETIRSIDFVSTASGPAPFLVAVTAEP